MLLYFQAYYQSLEKIQNFGQSTSHYYMALFVGTESDTSMKTVGFLT